MAKLVVINLVFGVRGFDNTFYFSVFGPQKKGETLEQTVDSLVEDAGESIREHYKVLHTDEELFVREGHVELLDDEPSTQPPLRVDELSELFSALDSVKERLDGGGLSGDDYQALRALESDLNRRVAQFAALPA